MVILQALEVFLHALLHNRAGVCEGMGQHSLYVSRQKQSTTVGDHAMAEAASLCSINRSAEQSKKLVVTWCSLAGELAQTSKLSTRAAEQQVNTHKLLCPCHKSSEAVPVGQFHS